MPLTPGTRIGPYEITGWLGAGGMGEVYRARDPRLARDVAIKLIPAKFAGDPTRVHRFEQEARAAGQLNHPNILAVYDLGTHEDMPYIVSELLEGHSLRSRLQTGALPARKAIDYAKQIAEGLAAAHGKNIVHRDLKPDNLFVTSDDRIKILDFGIAKLTLPGGDTDKPTGFPTETGEGTVMGTAGYMSPEQVRGEVVDPRSDLFSFGAVLYEMLSGRPAFVRPTGVDTMAAVLKEDPPAPLPSTTSPALERIVARCLEKARDARFQSARDLAFGLEYLSGDHPAPTPATGTAPAPLRNQHVSRNVWAAALLVVAALAFGAWYFNQRSTASQDVERFPIPLESGQMLDSSGGAHMIAISPDGQRIAYSATPSFLYFRALNKFEVKPIPGLEGLKGVREPVFSPDGLWIAFYAYQDQAIEKIAIGGGARIKICPADTPMGMTWGDDGITFGQQRKGILRVSPEENSTPAVLVPPKEGEVMFGPQVLPDHRQVLYTLAIGTARDRWENAQIVVEELSTHTRKPIIGGSDGRYVTTGHILYAHGGSLFAVAFDPATLTAGTLVLMQEGVSRAAGSFTGASQFSTSTTGSLIYLPAPTNAYSTLLDIAVMNPSDGNTEPLNLEPGPYQFPRASPKALHIAFTKEDGKPPVVQIVDLPAKSQAHPLTYDSTSAFPIFADDEHVAYQDASHGISLRRADGSGQEERLTTAKPGTSHEPHAWTGDTLFFDIKDGTDFTLWTKSRRDSEPRPFRNVHSSQSTNATVSSDGRFVAYVTSFGNNTAIHVVPYPGAGPDVPYEAKGSDTAKHPRWSPGVDRLFLDPNPSTFQAVVVRTQPTFAFLNTVSIPKNLQLAPPGARTPYDVMPDGRLLGLITAGDKKWVTGDLNQIKFVKNWFEELKQKVPHR